MVPGVTLPGLEFATSIGRDFIPSSSASSGPQRSGDIGGSTFQGINTGTQSGIPSWVTVTVIGMAAIAFVVLLRRR